MVFCDRNVSSGFPQNSSYIFSPASPFCRLRTSVSLAHSSTPAVGWTTTKSALPVNAEVTMRKPTAI